jgi:hypothetical protein
MYIDQRRSSKGIVLRSWHIQQQHGLLQVGKHLLIRDVAQSVGEAEHPAFSLIG